jgi:3-oxoacyl-[acyl-carrier protein] reductase
MSLEGKVVIVTGAGRGIGAGIAKRMGAEGAKVAITARTSEQLQKVKAAIEQDGGTAIAIPCDVGFKDDVERVFARVLETWGTVDVLINNAGWANPIQHILEMTEDHWDTVIRTNLKSVYLHVHRFANILVDQGKTGSIINVSSFAATRSHRYMCAYDASKGGMESMTRTMALDLAPFGIRANVIQPGAIHTEEHAPAGDEARIRRGQTVPLGRVGYPEDIAGAAVFLASDDASYITGLTVTVDGGMLAQLRSPQVDQPLPASVAARLKH